jgi:hypothetical protein
MRHKGGREAKIAKLGRMFDDGVGTVTRRPGVWKPLTE